jgi:tetratricopeptide (TPR) repeat protein
MKPYVNISVFEAGTAAASRLTYCIVIEGQTIASQNLSPVESHEVREISGQYRSLFEDGCKAEWAKDYFKTLGDGLFHLFFEDAWGQIKSRIDQGAGIAIISKVPDVLGLPWELLRLPDGRVLGFDEGFSIRRLPQISQTPTSAGQIPPGPLKVLFMACEPMDFELEEMAFLQGIEGLDIRFEICDTCSFAELVRRAERFRPHLVHLVGQGSVKDGQANFAFRNDGMPELKSVSDLGRALAPGGVQCIIFGGCQRESPLAIDLLCQGIVDQIPLAIGWSISSDFSKTLYRPLSSGETIDAAIDQACREGRKMCAAQDKICALPFLYAAGDQSLLFGERKTVETHLIEELMPLKGLTEGYTEDFVDRRRELARLIPAMREGSVRAVVVTGPAGAGKSALASMLASKLADEDYRAVAVYSSQYNPISAVRILEAGISELMSAGFADDARRLRGPAPLDQRMASMLDELNSGRFLLIIDGLDPSKETAKIDEPELAKFYVHLLRNVEGSRAIITCNALPADVMTMPRRAWEWQLGSLPQAAFINYLLQDNRIAESYSKGLIDYAGLQRLYVSAAGQPSCIAQMRKALGIGSENLNICDEIFSCLYSSLTSDSCLALARAAVYETAMNTVGLEAVTKEPEYEVIGMAREWQRLSLAYPVGELWAIPSHIRPWLLAHLSPEQLKDAHREAGIFLMDFASAGRSEDLRLSRLDCLMEARGHLMASGDMEKARLATTRISGYLERRGYNSEIIRQNEELLQHEMHAGPMILIGRAYLDQGSCAEAGEWFQKALESGPDAAACHGLGTAQFRQGKYDLARESFQKAVDICRISSDPQGEAAALHSLAAIDMEQNRNDQALERLRKVLEIQERLGDLGGEVATIQDIAMLFMRQGDYASAREKLMDSLKLLEQIGDDRGTASMLYNLASIDMNKGDYDLASDEFRKALVRKRALGDRSSEAAILHNLGSIDVQRGDMDSSKENFLRALEIYQDLNDKRGEAGAFFQLGSVAIQNNRLHEGLKLMALANIILISIGSEDVKSVEPVVERFAAQLNYSQEQFMVMVREVTQSYRMDKGKSLVAAAFGKAE